MQYLYNSIINPENMTKIPLYQVDAFTDKLFRGNPAAVCPLSEWLSADLMQQIAAENNLAETAFIVQKNGTFEIRWFTPTVEVDLCGHATLAAAFVLFNCLNYHSATIHFHSNRSGMLTVEKRENVLYLDFPTDTIVTATNMKEIETCLGVKPLEVYKGRTDFMAVLEREEQVSLLQPLFGKIAELEARGLIVTAPGSNVDFVSRFFAPQSGIDEDPVTGSAHTTLIPYWSKRLEKTDMQALQLSKRGGTLTCSYKGDRCLIGGNARLYMKAEIEIEQ